MAGYYHGNKRAGPGGMGQGAGKLQREAKGWCTEGSLAMPGNCVFDSMGWVLATWQPYAVHGKEAIKVSPM